MPLPIRTVKFMAKLFTTKVDMFLFLLVIPSGRFSKDHPIYSVNNTNKGKFIAEINSRSIPRTASTGKFSGESQ